MGGPNWWLKPDQIGGLLIGAILYRTSVFRKVDTKVGGPDWWLKPDQIGGLLIGAMLYGFLAFPTRFWVF